MGSLLRSVKKRKKSRRLVVSQFEFDARAIGLNSPPHPDKLNIEFIRMRG